MAANGQDTEIERTELTNWGRVISFHGPIAVIGIPFVLPFAFALLGKLGVGGDTFDLDYSEYLMLSASALVPCIYAYGLRIDFSMSRYLTVIALLVFVTFRVMASTGFAGSIPISFGGGLLGLGIASGLGYAGLAIHGWATESNSKRRMLVLLAVGTVVIGMPIGVAIDIERKNDIRRDEEWRAIEQVRNNYRAELIDMVATHAPDFPQADAFQWGDSSWLEYRLGDDVQFVFRLLHSGSQYPCVRMSTGSVIKHKGKDAFYDILAANRSAVEASMVDDISWTQPTIRVAPNGSTRIGTNGSIRLCHQSALSFETANWQEQHLWLAMKLQLLLEIVRQYHPQFEALEWRLAS